jgi:hypothetical protein
VPKKWLKFKWNNIMADLDPQLLKELNDNLRYMNEGVANAAAGSIKFAEGMTEAQKAEQEAAAISKSSKANMERATNEVIKSLAGFGKALTSGADGGFSKFSDGLTAASGAVVALSKNFGLLGTVLGTIVQVGTKVITMQLKQADDALKTSDEIKNLGNAGALSTKQVMEMVHNSGLSIEQSKKFTDAMKKAGSGVIGLGSNFGDGAVAFGKMVAVTNTQREGFQRLGISQEELMEYQGEYVALQKASGMQMSKQGKDGEALKKASLDYTRNLVELSSISGNDITTAKKNMEAERSRYEVMIDSARIQREINAAEKSNNPEKADMLKKELASRNALLDSTSQYLDENSKAGLAQFLATGAITDASKQFANAGIDMDSFRRRIKNGEDVSGEFAEAMKKAVARNLESVGTAALYDKSVGNNFLLNEKLIAFAQSRLDIDEKKLSQDVKTSRIAQENGTKEDTAENLRNKATTAAIVTTVKFDEILAATNPIISGFNDGLGLATIALTALAGAAVVALAAKGGGKAISSGAKALKGVFGKGAPALPGAGPGKLPGATTVADGATKAGAGKAAESAAKASAAKAAEEAAKASAAKAAEEAAKASAAKAAESAAKASAAKAAESAAKAGAGAATTAAGEAALKTAGATAGKAMLKSLPVIGSLLSVYSAYGKISSGDYMGAALEGGAAVAALVPGPGTAIALALTGASGARDVHKALNPELDKVPESVPAEPPKSVAQPTAPEVPQQIQTPGEAGRGAAAPAAAAPAAAAAPTSTASTAAGTMGAYKSRAASPAAAAPAAAAPAAAAPAAAAPAAAAPTSTASTAAGTMGAYKSRAASPDTASMASAGPISDVSKLLVFGGNSGTLETFKGLDSGLQKAVTSAAEEYNKSTGQKIKVNSAKRDSADQKRLWDESVEAGRPGWGPKGMQIARPGTSKHERGAAIDIQQYNDPVAVGLMNKYGMKQTVMPKDPVHFELKAKKGGMFNGPESGYPVEMHGNEIITPLSPNSILEQLGKTPATTEIAGSSSSSTTNTIKEIYSMNTEIMELLAGKLDTMISKLSDSNDTQSKLLMYSRV